MSFAVITRSLIACSRWWCLLRFRRIVRHGDYIVVFIQGGPPFLAWGYYLIYEASNGETLFESACYDLIRSRDGVFRLSIDGLEQAFASRISRAEFAETLRQVKDAWGPLPRTLQNFFVLYRAFRVRVFIQENRSRWGCNIQLTHSFKWDDDSVLAMILRVLRIVADFECKLRDRTVSERGQ